MRIKLLCLIVAGILFQQTVYGFVSAGKTLNMIRGIKKTSKQKMINQQDKLRLFKDFIRIEGGCSYDRIHNMQDPAWESLQGFRNTMKDGSLFSVLYKEILSTMQSSSK